MNIINTDELSLNVLHMKKPIVLLNVILIIIIITTTCSSILFYFSKKTICCFICKTFYENKTLRAPLVVVYCGPSGTRGKW